MESTQDLTRITTGTRFHLSSGHFGTIKYIGQVTGTDGLWYGVEWDDPTRGRHDGVKDGKRYFNCRIPNAGSFIRPSAPLSFGRSFLTALTMKYVEAEHGSFTLEKVVLGSSNGTIEVEAVGLDKVRRNLGNLGRLREVSLDCELVATGDAKGDILATCPNIRGLDFSASLLATWKSIADIAAELPHLERLALNRNRFLPLDRELPILAFSCLCELQLNNTLISWVEFRNVARFMTSLRSVELGHNCLESLSPRSSLAVPELLFLNLEDNLLDDWMKTTDSLREFTSLQGLVLSGNGIRSIPPLGEAPSPLRGIKSLALSRNDLRQWQCMDALHGWCPNLESLRMVGNPLTEDASIAKHARQFIIAKIPSLLALDSTVISVRERTDCELFYLSSISKHVPGSDNEKPQEHPQWIALCNKHGRPAESSAQSEHEDKLSKYLISVVVQRSAKSPTNLSMHDPIDTISPPVSVKVLKSMKLSIFRLKLIKSLKISNSRREAIQVWLKLHDGYVPLGNDGHNLEWYGIEDGTHLVVYTGE
ncbi:L domain-like protein [Imleria badia]|nr:L domain-like protein [Imleria badia]